MPPPDAVALYRFFDADGCLLYVGIAGDPNVRWRAHAANKSWWPQVTRSTVEWFATRSQAAVAEMTAIQGEEPLHNIAGKTRPAKPSLRSTIGRPPILNPRSRTIGVRMTRAEAATMREAAAVAGLSLGVWFRNEALAAAQDEAV